MRSAIGYGIGWMMLLSAAFLLSLLFVFALMGELESVSPVADLVVVAWMLMVALVGAVLVLDQDR